MNAPVLRLSVLRLIAVSSLLSLTSSCGITVDGDSKDKPKTELPVPLLPDSEDETGEGGDGSEPQLQALTVGETTSSKGDVVKDENGLFSLTNEYSFSLAEEASLRVRKGFSNGNCGPATASFIILKGEEQLADVTIDYVNNDYEGLPAETFAAPIAAGDYLLVAFITQDQECKGMFFYYDFTLEIAP